MILQKQEGGACGLIEFDKMMKRDFFIDKIPGAHESRFESNPKIQIHKKIPVIDFTKQIKREPFMK